MFTERTSVGLDVHARSVAAAAIDGVTGELIQAESTPSYEHIRSWIQDLPGPVAVACEAGPTGFGFAPTPERGGGPVSGRGAVEVAEALGRSGEDRREGRGPFGPPVATRRDHRGRDPLGGPGSGSRSCPGQGGLPRRPDAGRLPPVRAGPPATAQTKACRPRRLISLRLRRPEPDHRSSLRRKTSRGHPTRSVDATRPPSLSTAGAKARRRRLPARPRRRRPRSSAGSPA